ncbi:hypothetical protein [Azospirillum sp. B506]|uniref:hypothetical protein n=1 Tax=Azospirillum sp. B506 TaxID=137721 RepID=UPI00034D4D4C|nr:hypothetical protein [Azospirillum sp. B506]
MPYIELDRRFAPLSSDDVAGDPDWSAPATGADHGWADLLQEPVTVILGPGGAGKTTEMREQARRLRAGGRVAVFVALEQLLDQTLAEALDGEEAAAFAGWDPAGGEAVFLLDAVNEAKLARSGALSRALRAFAKGAGRGPLRVLLSCRPSDWQYQADADTVRDALSGLFQSPVPVGAPGMSGELDDPTAAPGSLMAIAVAPAPVAVAVSTVRLLPLDEARIRRLAAHYGVKHADAFIDALKETGHLFLAGRPRDLEWLAEYWNREGRIGTRWDMLELNVLAKLQEANVVHSESDPLSPEKALWGAERLAGATILGRQPAIRLPDPGPALLPARAALHPASVLPDWRAGEIAALLRRPLFEEAPGGRVRWHHASTQTYLAGRWLLGLLKAGCPVPTVIDLFSRELDGQRYLARSLREVAGWVVCRHAAVREALAPIAPEIVLLWGDAAQVPVEARAKALRILAQNYPETVSFDWFIEAGDLVRLADPALVPTVRTLLAEPGRAVAVRRFLLDLIRVGGWREAAETVLTIATDADQDLQVRTAAVEAVGAIDDVTLHARLRAYALETADLPNAFLARVGTALLPDALSVEDAAALLAKFTMVLPDGIGDETYAVAWRWVDAVRPDDRGTLLAHLLTLITMPPHASGQRHTRTMPLSERYEWLIHAVNRTVTLELARTAEDAGEPAPALMQGLQLLYECVRWGGPWLHDRDALAAALAANVAVRFALYTAALSTADHPEVAFSSLEGWFCQSQPGDVFEFLRRADEAETLESRRRLLLGACVVAHRHGLSDSMRERLATAIAAGGLPPAQFEELRHWIEPARVAPVHSSDTDADKAAAEASALADARRRLTEEIDALRRGEAFGALQYLVGQMRRLPGASAARWGQANIDSLDARFGVAIRDAAAEGLVRWWRSWCPPLPSQRDDPSSVEQGVVVGLTGLAVFAALGGDLAGLSPEDTRTAAHYALREINGPPDWFPVLLAAKPDVVGAVLKTELAGLFEEGADDAA